ncbi:unnamed protein product [Litomosoides sigmodontis]|uniref:Uncharacterized protein n=1 Tax=Litomosoides sigmodontis TaxID=42156 RepID=A0A3P6TE47_LITSI|nr:unnamed protein product [Litomosoides sigmodontis]
MRSVTASAIVHSHGESLDAENNLKRPGETFVGGNVTDVVFIPENPMEGGRNGTQLIVDAAPLKYMYIYVGILYLSVIIMVVVLDGMMPRLRGESAVTSSMRSADTLHSTYDEPRPVVHNVLPEYDTLRPSPILPLHNNG